MGQNVAISTIVKFSLLVAGVVIICCISLYTVLKKDLIESSVRNGRNLSKTVLLSTRYAMLHNDRQHLGNIVSNIAQHEGVEHLRIFNHDGYIMFSRNKSEIGHQVNKKIEGCSGCHTSTMPIEQLAAEKLTRFFKNERGVEVLAMSQPIYNEPACATSCHYHPATKKVLGMFDIGLDQRALQNSLSTMRYRMMAFTVITLILTVGGIAVLLNQSVLVPLKRLIKDTSDSDLVALERQTELRYGLLCELARNFHSLVKRLNVTHNPAENDEKEKEMS